jgi:hypothetical protein
LKSLTLLGGEPLANPKTMEMLRQFDVEKHPDAAIDLITNGSLLTEKTLSYLGRCTFGSLTISLNAGTPEVYERVQRGLSLDAVLDNLDALIRFRAAHHRWFGIALSFVAQPAAIDTLIDFAEIARMRNLPVRLMPLNISHVPGSNFYLTKSRSRTCSGGWMSSSPTAGRRARIGFPKHCQLAMRCCRKPPTAAPTRRSRRHTPADSRRSATRCRPARRRRPARHSRRAAPLSRGCMAMLRVASSCAETAP